MPMPCGPPLDSGLLAQSLLPIADMPHDANVIGPNVAKFRYRHGWTQDQLVARLNVLGCYMTKCILANIETRRCPATDKQIEYFAFIFGVTPPELFPKEPHFSGQPVGLTKTPPTRRRRGGSRKRTRRAPDEK